MFRSLLVGEKNTRKTQRNLCEKFAQSRKDIKYRHRLAQNIQWNIGLQAKRKTEEQDRGVKLGREIHKPEY
jgi:hypothetical protein